MEIRDVIVNPFKFILNKTTCLVFIGVGVVMIILPDVGVIDHLINSNSVMKLLKDTLVATGLGSENQYSGLSLSSAFYDIGLMLAVSCGVIMIVAMFGCCGGCCKAKCSLITYIFLTSFLLAVELILVIIVYTDEKLVTDSIKGIVLMTLKDYTGLAGKNVQTLGWNFVMVKYKCCGLINYKDFERSNWTRIVSTSTSAYTLKTPIVCCDPLPKSDNLTCATQTSTGNTAITGCFDIVWDTSFGSEDFIAIAYCIGFAIQFVLIILAVLVFMEAKKKNRVAAERKLLKEKRMSSLKSMDPLPEKKST
ncbi:tetraspanin-1-like [Saccostrea echinata]|uniref:tetraspanin-1-like n=1 Tax=Saccostrea echinata TaxID=191078 RepID=UPI002A806B28|nr:tetraspanin-1-like [Saccostrea echinata]